jgi:hypothetical protein
MRKKNRRHCRRVATARVVRLVNWNREESCCRTWYRWLRDFATSYFVLVAGPYSCGGEETGGSTAKSKPRHPKYFVRMMTSASSIRKRRKPPTTSQHFLSIWIRTFDHDSLTHSLINCLVVRPAHKPTDTSIHHHVLVCHRFQKDFNKLVPL